MSNVINTIIENENARNAQVIEKLDSLHDTYMNMLVASEAVEETDEEAVETDKQIGVVLDEADSLIEEELAQPEVKVTITLPTDRYKGYLHDHFSDAGSINDLLGDYIQSEIEELDIDWLDPEVEIL